MMTAPDQRSFGRKLEDAAEELEDRTPAERVKDEASEIKEELQD